MKVTILCLVLLQCLCCSGRPRLNFDLAPVAEKAVRMALARVNDQSASANLYGITQSSVQKVIPFGMNIYDLKLKFGIKETVCPKASESDPEKCQFKQGFFVPTASCSSRVRVNSELSELVSLTCSRAGSSSSSSSSESNSGEVLSRLSGTNRQNNFGMGDPVNSPIRRTVVDNRLDGNGLDNFME
uniref:Secreted phosphoprotein 24 n=2 Tax=Anguilla anguilla TaxID=7936 RepID=A0A0E9XSG9_ANGAN